MIKKETWEAAKLTTQPFGDQRRFSWVLLRLLLQSLRMAQELHGGIAAGLLAVWLCLNYGYLTIRLLVSPFKGTLLFYFEVSYFNQTFLGSAIRVAPARSAIKKLWGDQATAQEVIPARVSVVYRYGYPGSLFDTCGCNLSSYCCLVSWSRVRRIGVPRCGLSR